MNATIDVVVTRVHQAAEGILALTLARPDGAALPGYAAGAHIDVHMPPDTVRQYSLCGTEAGSYRVAVALSPGSRGGSRWLHDNARSGLMLRIGHPRHAFGIHASKHHVLIAGGIGITPLLAMACALRDARQSWELHYFAASAGKVAFADELAMAPMAGRCHVHVGDREALHAAVPRILDDAAGDAVSLYLCGPAAMMDAVRDHASARRWQPDRILSEAFMASAAPASTGGFTVVAARSGRRVMVAPGVSIADALMAEAIAVPLSCGQGVCGSCLTRVIEGTPDHRDMVQSDEEKAANTCIALCCSGALSETLVLDI